MKSGTFNIKPYEPGKKYGLKQVRIIGSFKKLRKHRSPLNVFLVDIGDKKMPIWFEGSADKKMSSFIRKRDGKCLKCGRKDGLTHSHFFGRSNYSTRYEPDNGDTLCVWCHEEWETEKAEGKGYYRFKIRQLGKERFDILEALSTKIVSREKAIVRCMQLLLN